MLAAATLESREYPDGVERISPGEVRLWDIAARKVRRTIPWSLRHCSVAFSPDGRFLAVAGWDEFQGAAGGKTSVWDVRTGERVAVIEGHRRGVLSVAFSPDGRLLATGGEHGTVKLSDTRTWQDRLSLNWDRHPIRDLAFSPDGETLAAGSDHQIQLWHGPKEETVLTTHHEADKRQTAELLQIRDKPLPAKQPPETAPPGNEESQATPESEKS